MKKITTFTVTTMIALMTTVRSELSLCWKSRTKKEGNMMKTARCVLALAFLLVAAGSAGAQKVRVDSDSEADFSKYNTFKIALHSDFTPQSPLMAQRAIKGAAYHLTLKGLREVGDSPDLSVVLYGILNEEKRINIHNSGYGYGRYWRGGYGGGMSTATTSTYTVGTLVIDLYDTSTRQLVWRGTATGTMSDKPAKNEKKLNKVLEKMFKKYPPERKK